MAALIVGGGTQILLISYEQFWLKENLDSISPYLTEHGVLVGLTLSALFFVGVSLATRPQPDIRLAVFFPDIAEKVFSRDLPRADRKSARYMEVASLIEEKIAGERSHLNLAISHCAADEECREDGQEELPWERFVVALKEKYPLWFTPTGSHIVYRLSQADMLACVKMVRGDKSHIWLSAEPGREQTERMKDELFLAYGEIEGDSGGFWIEGKMIEDIMVAVIGAGPAGSSAAEAAAALGMEVLLIDKKNEIGSPVQCGGFLPEAFELEKLMPGAHLPQTLRDIPERNILHRTQLQRIYSPSGNYKQFAVAGRVLDRRAYDRHLAARAAGAGARVMPATRACLEEGMVRLSGRNKMKIRPQIERSRRPSLDSIPGHGQSCTGDGHLPGI